MSRAAVVAVRYKKRTTVERAINRLKQSRSSSKPGGGSCQPPFARIHPARRVAIPVLVQVERADRLPPLPSAHFRRQRSRHRVTRWAQWRDCRFSLTEPHPRWLAKRLRNGVPPCGPAHPTPALSRGRLLSRAEEQPLPHDPNDRQSDTHQLSRDCDPAQHDTTASLRRLLFHGLLPSLIPPAHVCRGRRGTPRLWVRS